MCGIFGFLGKPPTELKEGVSLSYEILRALAIVSVQRGSHATGFAAVREGSPEITIDKRPIPSPIFVHRSLPFRQLPMRWPTMFIGHTRQATGGEPKNNRNNHPFTSGRFTLVHNGRIEKHEEIARKRNLTLRTETDSEVLIKILDAHEHVLPAIKEIASLDLAIATAFINHKHSDAHRLYLFRNTDRPMTTIYSKLLNTVFFVSTEALWEEAITKVMKREKAAYYSYLQLVIAELTPYLLSEISLQDGQVKWLDQVKIAPPISKAQSTASSSCATPADKKPSSPPTPPPEHKLLGTSVTPPGPHHEMCRCISCILTSASQPAPANAKKAIDTPPSETPRHILMTSHYNQIKRIIALLRDESFMTPDELKHWEEWRYKIVVRPH